MNVLGLIVFCTGLFLFKVDLIRQLKTDIGGGGHFKIGTFHRMPTISFPKLAISNRNAHFIANFEELLNAPTTSPGSALLTPNASTRTRESAAQGTAKRTQNNAQQQQLQIPNAKNSPSFFVFPSPAAQTKNFQKTQREGRKSSSVSAAENGQVKGEAIWGNKQNTTR